MLRVMLSIPLLAGLVFGREEAPSKRLNEAAAVFDEIMSTPDKAIPKALLDKAECIIIIPGMKKAALGIGGEYGRGFVSCRSSASAWGAPAGVTLAGGSFGAQLGVHSTDLVLLVMNKRGMEKLLSDKIAIGADLTAAAGPVGRTAAAATDAQMHAEILSWSRARGLFAGASLDGAIIRSDTAANETLYGKPLSTKEIVEANLPVPPAAQVLTSVLEKYAPAATHTSE